jgi:hypothetical protein
LVIFSHDVSCTLAFCESTAYEHLISLLVPPFHSGLFLQPLAFSAADRPPQCYSRFHPLMYFTSSSEFCVLPTPPSCCTRCQQPKLPSTDLSSGSSLEVSRPYSATQLTRLPHSQHLTVAEVSTPRQVPPTGFLTLLTFYIRANLDGLISCRLHFQGSPPRVFFPATSTWFPKPIPPRC